MKKIIVLTLTLVMLVVCTAFSTSALDYSERGITISLPDIMIEDKALADKYGMTNTWLTQDEGLLMDLLINVNDENYTYVNYSKKDITNLYEDYVGEDAQYYTFLSGSNITVGGFEGVRVDMGVDFEGTQCEQVLCAFSTETRLYTLVFYIYDSAYSSNVDSIINSVSIDGSPFNPDKENLINRVAYIIAAFLVSGIIALFRAMKAKRVNKKAKQRSVDSPISFDNNTNPAGSTNDFNTTQHTTPNYMTPPESAKDSFISAEAERERKDRENMFN